jgi:hypothetical protein
MRTLAVLPLLLAVVLLLTACGGGGKSTAEVAVTLKEWGVGAQPSEVKPGKVEFTVTNSGTFLHQFLVVKSDLPPGQLPTLADNRVDETKLNISGSLDTLQPGSSYKLELELFSGKYVLICNLVNQNATGPSDPHYLNGMSAGFLVLDE